MTSLRSYRTRKKTAFKQVSRIAANSRTYHSLKIKHLELIKTTINAAVYLFNQFSLLYIVYGPKHFVQISDDPIDFVIPYVILS